MIAFCGRCPHPTSGIESGNPGNNTNADGIERKREWSALEQIHSCFSFLQIIGKPFSIQDNQLTQYLIPVSISLRPFLDYIFTGKVQNLFQRCITWKYTLGFCDFPVLTVQSFYDVGCVRSEEHTSELQSPLGISRMPSSA